MDYIERKRRRLEIDLHVLTRRWHGTLGRMFVLRDRLDGIDPTDADAFSRTANMLGALANDATSLKRDVDKAKRRLASFDLDEFKADLGSALCHRFLTDDMDGLAAAYLKQGDGWVGTRTRNARKLGGDAYRRI